MDVLTAHTDAYNSRSADSDDNDRRTNRLLYPLRLHVACGVMTEKAILGLISMRNYNEFQNLYECAYYVDDFYHMHR